MGKIAKWESLFPGWISVVIMPKYLVQSAVGFKGPIHEPWRGNGVKLSVWLQLQPLVLQPGLLSTAALCSPGTATAVNDWTSLVWYNLKRLYSCQRTKRKDWSRHDLPGIVIQSEDSVCIPSEDLIEARRPWPWWDVALLCLNNCRESSRRMNHNAWHLFIIKPIILCFIHDLIDICFLTFPSILFRVIVEKEFYLSLSPH